jgi:release factor glutamine methyltransferase
MAETLDRLVKAQTARLAAAGIEGPQRDARLLIAHALRLTAIDLVKTPERRISTADLEAVTALIERRARHEPVSRIMGGRDFYGRFFRITPATLDPRPESETLIAAALAALQAADALSKPLTVLDVGTGSGCLLLTLLAELPHAFGVGSDISAEALDVARSNATTLGLHERVHWVRGDALACFGGPFDVLISNPPYIPSGEIAGLEPEVRGFDPRGALDGGADGLAVYQALANGLSRVIPNGWIFLEIGAPQANEVVQLLSPVVRAPINVHLDLAGLPRCVAAQTRG